MTSVASSDVDRGDAVQARKGAWHQSTLSTLLDGCSWQYFLQYELDLPSPSKPASVVGIAYHSALEAHELARMDGRPTPSLKELQALAVDLVRAEIDDEDLATSVKAAVKNWFSAPMKDGGLPHRDWLAQFEPVAIEPYFRLPLVEGAKPIAGWIDGVYRDPESGRLFLIDHKTAKNLSRWGHDGDEHRHQAAMYSVAVTLSEDFPQITDLPEMVYLVSRIQAGRGKTFEPARRVHVQPDLHDVADLGNRIRRAEARTQAEDYARTPEWVLCSPVWCPFYEGCMVTGELAGLPVTVRNRVSQK